MSTPQPVFRVLPHLDDLNRPFWQGGRDGQLVFWRCQRCRTYIHPPQPICPVDYGKDIKPEPVSGRATVASFTVNHQPWLPGPELPYIIGLVELEEQASVRLTTNIVGCAPDDVFIGMPVQVTFEHHEDRQGDVWIPLFEPRGA